MASTAGFSISSPAANSVLYQAQSATGALSFQVTGQYHNGSTTTPAGITYEKEIQGISVKVGTGSAVWASLADASGTWSAIVSAPVGEGQTLTVTATILSTTSDDAGNVTSTGTSTSTQTRLISVRKLAFTFVFPAASGKLGVDEDQTTWAQDPSGVWSPASIRFKLSDAQFTGQPTWTLDGVTGNARRDGNDATLWYVDRLMTPTHLGTLTLTVQAGGVQASASFTAVDFRPPTFLITFPTDGHQQPSGQVLTVSGSASDLQSGISSLSWSLDGGAAQQVSTQTDWTRWSFALPTLASGLHRLVITFKDKAGNATNPSLPDAIVNFEVTQVYRPQVANDLVSVRAYLEDLLAFSKNHVIDGPVTTGKQVDNLKLAQVFYQPFDKLSDARQVTGLDPVNQLRVGIEILRRYMADTTAGVATMAQLVAYWPFDEGSKATAYDASGNRYDVILSDANMWAAGRAGSTLSFDGVSQVVSLSAAAKLDSLVNNFTIAFWAMPKPDATIAIQPEATTGGPGISGERYVWGPRQGSLAWGSAAHAGVGISLGINGIAIYEHTDYYLPPLLVYQPPAPFSTWLHVAVVYQHGQPTLYIDGEKVRTGLQSPKSNVHARPEAIGGINYGHYAGLLDEVRVFDGPISPVEVALLASVRVPSGTPTDTVPSEADYCQASYEAILSRSGTSYEEIRLARGADSEVRDALAERLGIAPDPTGDRLKQLYLEPQKVTEPDLEKLFGVPDTHRDPLMPASDPLLSQWQRGQLRMMWTQQDKELFSAQGAEQPVIDPDLVSQADLRLAQQGNPAFDLWSAHAAWLSTQLASLQGKYNASLTAEQNLGALLTAALNHTLVELDTLLAKEASGADVDADLQEWRLDLPAYRRLGRLRALAKGGGTLSNAEWQDVYAILLQAMKRGQFKAWRDAEEIAHITLSHDYFVTTGEMPVLLPWRAMYAQRLDWQDRLQSRMDQEASLGSSQAAVLTTADQVALPLLRDALVGIWADRLGICTSDAAEYLTARLMVDLKASGSQQTTRLLQAVETVQNLLYTLRGEQMEPGHPANVWELAYKDSTGAMKLVEPDHFAGEWQWMSSYDAWRGVMLVFFFPENLLMPSLRPLSAQTQAFQEFLAAVRAKSRLSRQDARAAVQAFQRKVCGLMVHLPMDEGKGTTAGDASQNGNMASISSGAAWLTGELVGSLGLSGQAYLQIAHNAATLRLGANDADFSVSFSFYLREGFNHQWRMVIHKGQDFPATPTSNERTFVIFMMPEDNRLYYRISTTYSRDEGGTSKAEVALNSWTLVEYRKVGRQLQLYLNGELDSEVTLNGASRENAYPIRIGYDGTTMSASFAIKNFQVYNYGAATAQVAFSDYHTDDNLAALRQQSQQMLSSYLAAGKPVPTHLRELFYFVPMEAALQLQQSREFLAARDWFETVYAYRFPDAGRKIYYGLAIEQNQGGLPQRSTHWLLDELNPHAIAALRTTANSYTRFTLMSLARCFLEHADAEFATDTGPSLARARDLYLNARDLLLLPDFDPSSAQTPDSMPLPNPVLEALRTRAELQLQKLRQGRNIAGMTRQLELPAAQPATSGLPQIGADGQLVIPGAMDQLRPTPYHFRVLLDRAKQLTGIAQQMEAAFLAAMEKRDRENYDLLQAGYGLQLAQAGTELQSRRKIEAEKGTALAELQRDRAKIQQDRYQEWIEAGLNGWEQQMIADYQAAADAQKLAQYFGAATQIAQAITTAGTAIGFSKWQAYASVGAVAAGALGSAYYSNVATDAQTKAQVASIYAAQERRAQEWGLEKSLADQDWKIGDQAREVAQQHELVVQQEGEVARIQSNQAQAVANFLARKFTNAALYEWMSGVLGEVYSYFLQQATSTAQLAQNQLAFERQEPAPGYILPDYWQAPSNDGASGQNAPDRQGLTGSARLIEDITKLDQFAFETDRRKLNLSQTFSLAQTAPYEFALFRHSGILPFATPMVLFDQGFPGHYLRLIKQVRVSVIALIPPTQGIRATLISEGSSRVVTGGNVFQVTTIRRDPEIVALTSPANATGVFELDMQSEMLLPFEAMGVDTRWEFQMPRAANPFDFNTIADVLVTIDYTALNNFDYRKQVIKQLSPTASGERAFSLRDAFPDQWYQLHNPDPNLADPDAPLVISIETTRRDFPPHLDGLNTKHLLLSFLHSTDDDGEFTPEKAGALQVTLSKGTIYGAATPVNGTISTRNTSGTTWRALTGEDQSPAGTWTLTLPVTFNTYFATGKIQDILFTITFAGRTPSWPA